MNKTQSANGGISFLSALVLLFIGLKLGGVIDWSWWWVFAPWWGVLVAIVGLAITGRWIYLIAYFVSRMRDGSNR